MLKLITSADSVSVMAPAVVGAVTHADPNTTITLQVISIILPWIPRIITAVKTRRAARKAAKK